MSVAGSRDTLATGPTSSTSILLRTSKCTPPQRSVRVRASSGNR